MLVIASTPKAFEILLWRSQQTTKLGAGRSGRCRARHPRVSAGDSLGGFDHLLLTVHNRVGTLAIR
jgi:hypothetical protein